MVNTKHYNSFDIAKFICSVLVVMIHISPLGDHMDGSALEAISFGLRHVLCRIAVPMFFVFSGFFLYRKIAESGFSPRTTRAYLWHILKLYLIWSLIYFPVRIWSIVTEPGGIWVGIITYIRDFALVGSHLHLWYLNALMFSVALISFLLYKRASLRTILYISGAFYILGLLGETYYGVIEPLTDVAVIGDAIKLYFAVFTTTRNGLFFAFLFVALGMALSSGSITLPKKISFPLFVLSLIMMFIEMPLLEHFGLTRDYNMLVFTVPTVLFLFWFLEALELKDRKIYKTLRKVSTLIYLLHLIVNKPLAFMLSLIGLGDTPIEFICTLAATIAIALAIIKLSDRERFGWLNEIY